MKIPGLTVPGSKDLVPEKLTQKSPVTPSEKSNIPKPAAARFFPTPDPAKALGLPADRLSASIISFARFFSLQLEPALLTKIRLQALSAEQDSQTREKTGPQSEALSLKNREALSLAGLAAASKGVELTGEGLKNYAAALDTAPIDPDQEQNPGQNTGEHDSRRCKNEDANKRENKNSGASEIDLKISELKARICYQAEENPLLEALNRLPGKNGQRWLVLPFNCNDQGEAYRLCLKVLLEQGNAPSSLNAAGFTASLMALEINNSTGNQRMLFIINSDNGKNLRLRVCVDHLESSKAKSLVSEISGNLNIAPESIIIDNFNNSFPFEAENQEKVLLSINKEV